MANDGYVIGKADVRVMLSSIIARCWRVGGIGIHNKSALDVDCNSAWGKNGMVNG